MLPETQKISLTFIHLTLQKLTHSRYQYKNVHWNYVFCEAAVSSSRKTLNKLSSNLWSMFKNSYLNSQHIPNASNTWQHEEFTAPRTYHRDRSLRLRHQSTSQHSRKSMKLSPIVGYHRFPTILTILHNILH